MRTGIVYNWPVHVLYFMTDFLRVSKDSHNLQVPTFSVWYVSKSSVLTLLFH
mgnify:CR=1 FL=1